MTNDKNTNVADLATDKLTAEMTAAKDKFAATKDKFAATKDSHIAAIAAIQHALTDPVGSMLIRFCYQDSEVAQAVHRSTKTLTEVIETITKDLSKSNVALSDVEAYARAVKEYLHAAQVSVNFRVLLPNELDDDLALINDVPREKPQTIILDLFGTEE
jgi:hypothetical protein